MSRATDLMGRVALVAPTVVAIVAGTLWYIQVQRVIPYEKLDLGESEAPRTSYVELSAVAHPSIQVMHREGRHDGVHVYYIPLLPPNWNGRSPISYFLRSEIDYTAGLGSAPSDDSGAFAVVDKGVLEAVPPDVVDRLKRKGLTLANAPVALNTDPFVDQGIYLIVTAVSSGLALITWVIILFAYLATRQQLRRAAFKNPSS